MLTEPTLPRDGAVGQAEQTERGNSSRKEPCGIRQGSKEAADRRATFNNKNPRPSRVRTCPVLKSPATTLTSPRKRRALKRSEVAKRKAQVEIEKGSQYEFEGQRLRAEEIAREEVSKQRIEIAAAEAERQRRIAKGRADATLAAYNAEAEGQRAVHQGTRLRQLVDSAGGDAKAAATLLMVEKIEELVARQTEAIANLKIDESAAIPATTAAKLEPPPTSSPPSSKAFHRSMMWPRWLASTCPTTWAR